MANDTPRVNLDLDTLEREHVRGLPEKKDPFVVNLDGRVVTFKDAVEVDALVLMDLLSSPARFFKGTLDGDDYRHVMDVYAKPGKLPGWKLNGLMQAYQDYYGLDDQGNVVASRR